MSFQTFTPVRSGSKGIGDGISVTSVNIAFGKRKPPYKYVVIKYDIDNIAIRLSQGTETDGYRVLLNKGQNYYYINATSFINKDYLPKGRYAKIGDNTYQQTKVNL